MCLSKIPLKGEKGGYVIEERCRDAQMMCVLHREKTSVTPYSAVLEHTKMCVTYLLTWCWLCSAFLFAQWTGKKSLPKLLFLKHFEVCTSGIFHFCCLMWTATVKWALLKYHRLAGNEPDFARVNTTDFVCTVICYKLLPSLISWSSCLIFFKLIFHLQLPEPRIFLFQTEALIWT